MSILSDTDLEELVNFNEDKWRPYQEILIENGLEQCFNPMGYDLRVGGFYKTLIEAPHLRPIEKDAVIKPGEIALIGTYESLKMPQNGKISALILSKVSIVAKGLSNISTKVDPGWQNGELLITVQNVSKSEIRLKYQQQFCTLVFFENRSNAKNIYKKESKTDLIKLLAATSQKNLRNNILIESIPVVIIIISLIISYFVQEISPNVAALTGAVVSPFIKYLFIAIILKQE